MTTTPDPMAEIRVSFFLECEELLESLQDGLDIMETTGADSDTINVVFRTVHSIKGGAGAFGLEGLVRFAHRFETALDDLRGGRVPLTSEGLKTYFQAADHLSDLVRAHREGTPTDVNENKGLLSDLDNLAAEDSVEEPLDPKIDFQPMPVALDLGLDDAPDDEIAPPNPSAPACCLPYQIKFEPTADLFSTGNDPALLLRNLAALGRMTATCDTKHVPDLAQLDPEQSHLSWTITLETNVPPCDIASVFEFVEGLCTLRIDQTDVPIIDDPAPPTLSEASGPPPSAPATKSVVRVDIDRIDRLVNLVGELVINQAMLSQSLENAGVPPYSPAMDGVEEYQRLTRDIQDSVMMIRAQPLKPLFQRMARMVREASNSVGKDVRLYFEGEETEIDKTVIERLVEPLTHMIRNAVDHGIESFENRCATDKPAQGRVTLRAAHKSGRVVIDIADDGAGIDRAKVRQIAIDKGLIPPGKDYDDAEIDELLFMPGFSTAGAVSDLSGRGVGLDVVRNAIQTLGGRITVLSEPGQGTTLSISLPLTLAVVDGMVVRAADETLVIPLNFVIKTLTPEPQDVDSLRPGYNMLKSGSGLVPLFDLGAMLGYREAPDALDGTDVLLIGDDDKGKIALAVDRIVDQRQVVIKGLDDKVQRAPGIAAATILGDGHIALILDPLEAASKAAPRHKALPYPTSVTGAIS